MTLKTRKILQRIVIALIVLLGSLHCFNTGNLLMSDVANYANKLNFPYIFTTFAHLPISLSFILGMFLLVRGLVVERTHLFHMIKTYCKIEMGFSLVGIICSIITGTLVYHSFVAPYPYQGATFVALFLNIALLFFCIFVYLHYRKPKYEDIKLPFKAKHVFRTILMSLLAFIAFNRFGAFLALPFYTEWHYFYLTVWFYLTLPLPLLNLLLFVLFRLRVLVKKKEANVIFALTVSGTLFVISTALSLVVMFIAMKEPMLISLISPAMPLERLATIPFDFIFIVLTSVVPALLTFIFEITKFIKMKKQAKNN